MEYVKASSIISPKYSYKYIVTIAIAIALSKSLQHLVVYAN